MEQLDALFQTFHGAPRGTEIRDPEAHRTNVFMEFMKLKPPLFDGLSEHATAESWLKVVKEKFDTLGVLLQYRVGFATYLFEGSVEEWWDLHMDDDDVSSLTWDEFETIFREKYVPGTQSAKLVQGGMTVAQYHARFVALSDCDPAVVADPILRCVKFKDGLRPKIRSQLAALPTTDFSVLVAAALLTEADLIRSCGGNKRTSTHNKKVGKKAKCHGKKKSSGRYKPYPCTYCKQTGHVRQNCTYRQANKKKQKEKRRRMLSLTSLDAHNSRTPPASDQKLHGQSSQGSKTKEGRGFICPTQQQRSTLFSGGQQKSQVSSASSGAHDCQTIPTSGPGCEKDRLRGQSSQSSETKEGDKNLCYLCQQKGHFKRNCPYRQEKSLLTSGEQQKSEFGPTSSVQNSQTHPAPKNNSSIAFTSTSQPRYYPTMLPQLAGFSQHGNAPLTSQAPGSQFGLASLGRPAPVNSFSASYTSNPQPHGLLLQHMSRMLPQTSGFQQRETAPLIPQASGSQFGSPSSGFVNGQTQLAPHKNQLVSKKGQLQGWKSQGSDTSGKRKSASSMRIQPNTCHFCHQIGHLKRSCPYGQQQSALASGVQQ